MSSDFDPLAVGGGGLAGAGFVAGVVKLLFGGAIAELKEQMRELKSDMRESAHAIQASVEKHGAKLDATTHTLTLMEAKVASAHQRLDILERDVRELDSRCVLVHGGKAP